MRQINREEQNKEVALLEIEEARRRCDRNLEAIVKPWR